MYLLIQYLGRGGGGGGGRHLIIVSPTFKSWGDGVDLYAPSVDILVWAFASDPNWNLRSPLAPPMSNPKAPKV